MPSNILEPSKIHQFQVKWFVPQAYICWWPLPKNLGRPATTTEVDVGHSVCWPLKFIFFRCWGVLVVANDWLYPIMFFVFAIDTLCQIVHVSLDDWCVLVEESNIFCSFLFFDKIDLRCCRSRLYQTWICRQHWFVYIVSKYWTQHWNDRYYHVLHQSPDIPVHFSFMMWF